MLAASIELHGTAQLGKTSAGLRDKIQQLGDHCAVGWIGLDAVVMWTLQVLSPLKSEEDKKCHAGRC